ncbi:hypothetical protein P0L94_00595 [Microbacter sp. GSS18]|nr:hypothetical protein P0L94_00595 [Microbacter sp. GSS18]
MDRTPENEQPTPETVPDATAGVGEPEADATSADAAETTRIDAPGGDEDSFETVRLNRDSLDADSFDTVRITPAPDNTDAFDTVQLDPPRQTDEEFAALGLPTHTHATDAYNTVIMPPPEPAPAAQAAEPAPATGEVAAQKTRDPDAQRWWATLLALPAGVFAALIGLGPWALTGARLPLQDLWVDATPQSAMPFALLPLSQTTVIPVFSYLIVGAALAGILGRALHLRGVGLFLLEIGVLGIQGWAAVQATMVLREGLQDRFESAMYIVGLVTGTSLSILSGVLVTMLIAAAPRAGALLGLTAGAIGMTAWTTTLLFTTGVTSSAFAGVMLIVPWIAPVLTGLAMAWTGLNTVGRVISAIVALAMIWIAPAVTTAVANALGNRVIFRNGDDLLAYGSSVFRSALTEPSISLPPVIVAAAIGAVIAGGIALIRVLTTQRDVPATR